jgi:glycosyltransferase involved in cell wall biosynthesis
LRILILTASLPYPTASGGALRVFGMIRGLYEQGHDVHLLAYGDVAYDWRATPLGIYCQQVDIVEAPTRSKTKRLSDFLTGKADIAGRLYSDAYWQKLQALVTSQSFDMVQFEGIEIACFLLQLREAHPDLPICFDTFNAEAVLQRNIFEIDRTEARRLPMAFYSWVQSRRLVHYEGKLCRHANLVIAVSEEDAELLQAYQPRREVVVVPSGIITDDYSATTDQPDIAPKSIVFTGKMDYRPNVDAMLWFYEAIFPQMQEGHLVIVGQKPHPRLQPLLEDERVTITGWVDSVQPYLQHADVYVAPLRMGSGTRLKILEALASGCAIVATTTAVAGLNQALRDGMLIRDEPEAFAQAIHTLLNDDTLRETLQSEAPALVREYYDWSVLIHRLLKAYSDMQHDIA